MASLDNIGRAHPKPFFFTRLQARMERRRRNAWEKMSGILARPAVAVLSVVTVIVINAVVIVNKTVATSSMPDYPEMAIADEYNSTVAYYAIENVQP